MGNIAVGLHHVPELVTRLGGPHRSTAESPATPDNDIEATEPGAQSPEPTAEHIEGEVEGQALGARAELDQAPNVPNDNDQECPKRISISPPEVKENPD